jgi:methylphosphotriester-DNA--protein-cysteine methyltransferase
MLNNKEKYNFIGKRDKSYDGIFYTAVKTTGIFCLPSCRAKKPLEKNVIFFNTINEAIVNNFRACKVCKPQG